MPPLPTSDLDEILTATAPLWSQLRNQHLFLTGGTGFFGHWLTESFLHANRQLQLNAQLTLLTRDPAAFLAHSPHLAATPQLHLLQGDIRTFTFPPGDFPWLIHAATQASAHQAVHAPAEMLSTIVDGTRHILDFAATHATRSFLLVSSGAVYGPQPPTLSHLPEDHPFAPTQSVYAQGKRQAEHLCALHARTSPIQIKIARPFAFLGPHLPLHTHFAAGNFLADALASRPIHIASDGRALRSYLYPTDLTIALWTLLFRAPSLRPFNLGSEHPVSIADLARIVAQIVAPTLAPALEIHTAQPPASGLPPHYLPSTARAQSELQLHQTVSLPEAVRRTAAWHRLKS